MAIPFDRHDHPAGDIIHTGTPGAVVIRSGDIVRCEVDGFPALENPVA